MIKVRLNSAAWGNSIAWMCDQNGVAIGVDNHMQSGEFGEDLVDEWGVVTAYAFGIESNQSEYCEYAKIVAYWILTCAYLNDWDDIPANEPWDWTAVIAETVDHDNIEAFKAILQLPKFTETAGDVYDHLLDLGLDPDEGRHAVALVEALRALTTLFQRLMMRVRAGGLTNSTERGAKELYFRIPDTKPEQWYTGIANFIWDHPEYAAFECYIYSDINGTKTPLKEFATCKEYLDLHSSRQNNKRKLLKFNSCFRQSAYYYQQFLSKVDRYRRNNA